MATKKPDSKGILCDPLCLFRGLTFIEKSPQTLMFTDFLAIALTASLPPRVGLEPTTTRLTAECSTIELSRITLPGVCCTPAFLRGAHRPSGGSAPSKPNTDQSLSLHASFRLPFSWLSLRLISRRQLSALLRLHTAPIYLVVFKASLNGHAVSGHLISGGASRLDAFSVYPLRAWLPCCRTDS